MGEESIHRGSRLIAASVNDPDGNYLGNIEELLIDLEEGRVNYVVVCLDGRHRTGTRRVVLPWGLLRVDRRSGVFVTQASESALERLSDIG